MRGDEFDIDEYVDPATLTVEQALLMRDESRHKDASSDNDDSLEHIVNKAIDQGLKKLLTEATKSVHGATDTAIMPELDDTTSSNAETIFFTGGSSSEDKPTEVGDDVASTENPDDSESVTNISDDVDDEISTGVSELRYLHESDNIASEFEAGLDFVIHYDGLEIMKDTLEKQKNSIIAYQTVLRSKFKNVDEIKKYLTPMTSNYFDPQIYQIIKLIYTEPHPWLYIMSDVCFGYKNFFFEEAKNEFDYILCEIKML